MSQTLPSPKVFARKFDSEESKELLDKIDKRRLGIQGARTSVIYGSSTSHRVIASAGFQSCARVSGQGGAGII
jgi:hypothetical protein